LPVTSTIDANILYNSAATVRVVFAGDREQFMSMNRAISVARLRPVIDRVFTFGEVAEAFRYYESAKPFGKVIIKCFRSMEMERTIIARWQEWSGKGIEHLVLRERPDRIVAEGVIVSWPIFGHCSLSAGHAVSTDNNKHILKNDKYLI
jgi:hypothetical protein